MMLKCVYRYWIDECCDPKPHVIDRYAPVMMLAGIPLIMCLLALLGFDFTYVPPRLLLMAFGFGSAGWIFITGMFEAGAHTAQDAKRRTVYFWMMTPFLAMWLVPLAFQWLGY